MEVSNEVPKKRKRKSGWDKSEPEATDPALGINTHIRSSFADNIVSIE